MRIDAGQHLRLSQQMKLAPRMIQSMEILQMPMQALEARVEQELASNPTIELVEAGDEYGVATLDREQARRDDTESARELVVEGDANGDGRADATDDFERLATLTEEQGNDWESSQFETGGSLHESFEGDYSSRFARGRLAATAGDRDGKLDAMANTAGRGPSLYEQLIDQWHLAEVDDDLREIGEYLISHIDADGYLRTPREDLLAQAPAAVKAEHNGSLGTLIDEGIDTLQRVLEPVGLAARDLRECLLLQIKAQLKARPDADLELARDLVAEHLKDIENNRLPAMAKAFDADLDEIKAALGKLRQFHPHPGRLLADEEQRAITPDAIIEYDEENDAYIVSLTNNRIPPVQINRDYELKAKDREEDRQTREFLQNNLRSAHWLIDAIQQRNHTLMRVISVVVAAPNEFFDEGPQALKPLLMTQVADQLGIHVATVSRAVSEKYLQTPRGIFPLRMFFSGGTETEEGESMSWQAVQAKLKDIIDAEDKSKPLSDDALAKAMQEQGIDIARRTVAKYRKELGIASARQRKEY